MSKNLTERKTKMFDYLIKNSPSRRTSNKRGRPRVEVKKQFKNVAVPKETHAKIIDLADLDGRSIARQLQFLIDQSYTQKFGSNSN